jgi:undecaprenyl-diphosphatase
MNIFQAVILSIIEGITEFLPISSTGHLILASHVLRIPQTEFVKSFEIIIQLGAIVSVVVLYFKKLIHSKMLYKRLLLSFLPTALFGFTLYRVIKTYLLGNSLVVVLSLFIGGIFLILFEKYFPQKKTIKTMENASKKDAVIIGLFQSVSMVPGVSRSAATIIGGMTVGFDRKSAVEFSFLLAIPTMAAATGLDLVKSGFSFSSYEFLLLGIGFIVSFITAWVAVKYFLSYVQKNTLVPFGMYRILIAILFLLFIKA